MGRAGEKGAALGAADRELVAAQRVVGEHLRPALAALAQRGRDVLVRACRAWQLRWSDRHGDLSKVQLALRLVQHVGAAGLESAAVVRAAVGGPNWDESRRAPVGLDPLTGTAVPKAWGQAAMLEHLLRHDAPGGDGVVTELAEHKCLNPVVALLVYYRQGGLLEQLQAPPALEDDHECSGCGRHTPREAVWDAEADGDDFVRRFNEAMDQEGSMEPCPGCGILHHSRDLTKKHLDELGHLQHGSEFAEQYRAMRTTSQAGFHALEVHGVLYGVLPEAIQLGGTRRAGMFCKQCIDNSGNGHTTFVTFDYARPPQEESGPGDAAAGSVFQEAGGPAHALRTLR